MARKKLVPKPEDETVLVHFFDPNRKKNCFILTNRKTAEIRQMALMLQGMDDVRVPLFEYEAKRKSMNLPSEPLPQKRVIWGSSEAKKILQTKKKRGRAKIV